MMRERTLLRDVLNNDRLGASAHVTSIARVTVDDNGSQLGVFAVSVGAKARLKSQKAGFQERLLIRITSRCQGSGAVFK